MAALNPWDRLGLDVVAARPGHPPDDRRRTCRSRPGTPIGLGDINLRVGGDLYLYKDPAEPLSSPDRSTQISGTYAFQGRRFDIDRSAARSTSSAISNPEIYVTVTRVISGVETRVTIIGPLQRAGAAPGEHAAARRVRHPVADRVQHVDRTAVGRAAAGARVRAGTLAAGFLAAPLLRRIESELGLDIFEIEPAASSGPDRR